MFNLNVAAGRNQYVSSWCWCGCRNIIFAIASLLNCETLWNLTSLLWLKFRVSLSGRFHEQTNTLNVEIKLDWGICLGVCPNSGSLCVCVCVCVCVCLQPPPRRPLNFAETHETEEEKQFRRVFKQLAGDVSPQDSSLNPVWSSEFWTLPVSVFSTNLRRSFCVWFSFVWLKFCCSLISGYKVTAKWLCKILCCPEWLWTF